MTPAKQQSSTQTNRQAARHRMQWRWTLLASLPTLAAFLLYVPTLGLQSLWFDEGLSVAFASRGLPELFRTLVREDIHPPLYYLMLHFWMQLAGNSEWALRFISAFHFVLTVPLAYAVTHQVWGRQEPGATDGNLAAIAASALVATSPFLGYYAQEARMYALAAMLALAALWAYLRAVQRMDQGSWLVWLPWSILIAAGLYAQYFSAFILPAFWLYALFLDHRALRGTVLGTIGSGVLYLPWVWPAIQQMLRMFRSPDYWVTTRLDFVWFLRTVGETFVPSNAARLGLLAAAVGAIVTVVVALRSSLGLSERLRRHALLLFIVASPLALSYVAITIAPKFTPRYAIVAAPPLYIALSLLAYAPLRRCQHRGAEVFAVIMTAVIALSAPGAVDTALGRRDARDDARGLAAYLSSQTQPEESILLVENAPYALQYYFRGAGRWYGLHVGQDFQGAAGKLNEILSARPGRVWLVLWHHEFADPTDMVATELLRVGREVTVPKQFRGYQLRAFDIINPDTVIDAAPVPQTRTDASWPGLQLLGFDRWRRSGGQLHYAFYWQATRRLDRNYSYTWTLRDAEGNEYLRKDQALSTPYFLPPAWPIGVPVRGHLLVSLPSDLPAGRYSACLQVFDPLTAQNLDISNSEGMLLGQLLPIESFPLAKSDLGVAPTQPPNPLSLDLGEGLHLTGFRLSRTQYAQGDTARLTLWWQSDLLTPARKPFVVRLINDQDRTGFQVQLPILAAHERNLFPGETNRAIYPITIPADLPAGEYRLQAGSGERLTLLTTLQVDERERQYVVPSMQYSIQADFGPAIALLGYDMSTAAVRAGDIMTATLYWQCRESIADSYKVSVQLLSADMQAVAQDDAVPARWSRPTKGWLPGEIVTDEHTLALDAGMPAGDYDLIVVMYNELSGDRLIVQEQDPVTDYALLSPVLVQP
jgi:mannosyltransferase